MVTLKQLFEALQKERIIKKDDFYVTPKGYEIVEKGLKFPALLWDDGFYGSYAHEVTIKDIRMCEIRHTSFLKTGYNGYNMKSEFYVTYEDDSEAEIHLKCFVWTQRPYSDYVCYMGLLHLYFVFDKLGIPYKYFIYDFVPANEIGAIIKTICEFNRPDYLKLLYNRCFYQNYADIYIAEFVDGCENALGVNDAMNAYLLSYANHVTHENEVEL